MRSAIDPDAMSRATGAEIRARRQQLGLTQAQLAERLGCQQPQIAALEAGHARCSIATLERIADALDATIVPLRLVARDEAMASPVPHYLRPRHRCGYVGPSSTPGGRAKICNRVSGHPGQHRMIFESEAPPNIWD
jgi:DNA-binding XRE family transcriptional regulator